MLIFALLPLLVGAHASLEQYEELAALHATDVDLFFHKFLGDIEKYTPIYYTPIVGLACQNYGRLRQVPASLIVSLDDLGQVESKIASWEAANHRDKNVSVIVVTDGERILGLGDLGVWGMGIPVGKLALYTAMAGIHPALTLPVVIDAGTRNVGIRNDPKYLGLKQERDSGPRFLQLVDEFVQTVKIRYPGVLLQFEDFGGNHAFELLEHYEEQPATFNDDIQGTAAVTVAGLLAAIRGVGGNTKKDVLFSKQRFVFYGAGQAAIGIADLIAQLIVSEENISEEEARKNIVMLDSKGIIHADRSGLSKQKKKYAHKFDIAAMVQTIADNKVDLLSVVTAFQPHVLIGVSGQPQTFTEAILKEMARIQETPIIMALSNPTSMSECTAEQAYKFTNDRAIFASGSPFPEYTAADGSKRTPGQANNCYVFPGIGLGVQISRATRVTQRMMLNAAIALASKVSAEDLGQGRVFVALDRSREISADIAAAVAASAFADGYALESSDDWVSKARNAMYVPRPKKEEL